jgi:DNA-binding transcriptional LysR family regulator
MISGPLRSISTFVRSAQTGSFSKAALELGITPQAVSGHIKQLEDWAGVRLFHRTTRKISLTEEGWAFYERCKSGMESIEEGLRGLREATDEAVGTVRLAVPYAISRGFIVPVLASFFERYPRVAVDLIIQNHSPDLVDQGVDLGIASGTMPKSSLIARKVGAAELILCAAPSYLRAHGKPRTMNDLNKHRCVTLRHPRTGKIMPWTFRSGDKSVTLDIAGYLTTNDTDTQRQAVLEGIGIGQLASFFVSPHLRAGRLEPLLIGYIAPPIRFYLYMPRRTKIPKKTRVLADHLYRALSHHPDFQPVDLR